MLRRWQAQRQAMAPLTVMEHVQLAAVVAAALVLVVQVLGEIVADRELLTRGPATTIRPDHCRKSSSHQPERSRLGYRVASTLTLSTPKFRKS